MKYIVYETTNFDHSKNRIKCEDYDTAVSKFDEMFSNRKNHLYGLKESDGYILYDLDKDHNRGKAVLTNCLGMQYIFTLKKFA